MVRPALTLLIALHAGIHVLGFLKWWKLAELPQLTARTLVPVSEATGRTVGVIWLLAMLALLAAAGLRFARNDYWWPVALVGAAISQALIVLEWPDAKAGTLPNVVIAVAVIVAAATERFKGRVHDEVRDLFASASRADSTVVRPPELERLPAPVRRWLVRSGVVGKPRARAVRLKQRGGLRTSPEQGFMPAEAEQYFSVDPPGFVWSVDVRMFGAVPIVGCDSYVRGKGHMLIRALSLVNVVDASGERIDQGTLLRYLGEIIWFPSAALSPHITWEPVDAERARATMTHQGVTASAVFSFDGQGRFTSLAAERYMGAGPDAPLTDWFVPASAWRLVRGVELPVRGNVVWKLSNGDFDYYRWEILDVEYDTMVPYPHATVWDRPSPPSPRNSEPTFSRTSSSSESR